MQAQRTRRAAPTGLHVGIGQATRTGRAAENQDFAACYVGPQPRNQLTIGLVAALADGMGGAKGGRVAAELAVRGFIEGCLGQPATLGVARIGARAADAVNRWINTHRPIGSGPERHGLHPECTGSVRPQEYPSGPCWGLARLPPARQRAVAAHHRPHAGRARHDACADARGGRGGQLARRSRQGNRALARSLPHLQRRRAWRALAQADPSRCSPGARRRRKRRCNSSSRRRRAPNRTTRPRSCSMSSHCPKRSSRTWKLANADQPLRNAPSSGDVIDDYELGEMLADGAYTRVFRARDRRGGRERRCSSFRSRGRASSRCCAPRCCARCGSRVTCAARSSPRSLEPPAERRTCLYGVLPYYEGETLERRLRAPSAGAARRGPRYRDQAHEGAGGAASRRHHPSRHQAREHHARSRTAG